MEEAGPPGPKMVRVLCFAGAGVLLTFAINKWKELERNSIKKQNGDENSTKLVPKAAS
ncbi:hypothetical protein LINPERHAP2_LOCUS39429 [Linum perenne]